MKRDAKHAACEGAEEILWSKYKARGAELATLRAENARLTADLSKLRDDLETLIQQRDEAQRRRGEIEAECGALRADVVWCVENPYRILDSSGMWDDMPGDAPDADILRAVREARTK